MGSIHSAHSRLPNHFDPIRAHRSYGVPDGPSGCPYEFVPNRRADYLNVFDLAQRRWVKRIAVAHASDVTATTIDGRWLYQAGEYLAMIDLETLAVVRTLSGNGINACYALNVFPDGQRMFLFNTDGSLVVMRDAADPFRMAVEKVIRINQPALPDASVGGKGHFTADGKRYINANWHTDALLAVDLERDYEVSVVIPSGFSRPDDLVMLPDDRKGYIASHGRDDYRGAVHVFDVEERRILRTIEVGRRPAGLTMSPDSRIVYVTNVPDGSISAIDTHSDEVLFMASAAALYRQAGITGDHLDIEGVTVSADGKTLYAYAVNFGALVIFDDLNGTNRPTLIMGESA
jgi:hypothetical protein